MITLMDAVQALRPGAECNIRGDVYSGIEWLDKIQLQPTEDELNAKVSELQAAEPHRLLRIERDRRLAECDWVVTKHVEHGKMVPEKWKIYRQALRDLPNISYRPELDEYGKLKMDSVAWPTPPSD